MPYEDNFYEINFVNMHKADVANLEQYTIGDGALELWHYGLGHLSIKNVHTLQNMGIVINLC